MYSLNLSFYLSLNFIFLLTICYVTLISMSSVLFYPLRSWKLVWFLGLVSDRLVFSADWQVSLVAIPRAIWPSPFAWLLKGFPSVAWCPGILDSSPRVDRIVLSQSYMALLLQVTWAISEWTCCNWWDLQGDIWERFSSLVDLEEFSPLDIVLSEFSTTVAILALQRIMTLAQWEDVIHQSPW